MDATQASSIKIDKMRDVVYFFGFFEWSGWYYLAMGVVFWGGGSFEVLKFWSFGIWGF